MDDEEEVIELYACWKQEVLKELRPFLASNLEPQKLYTYLRSRNVLDESDQEEIEVERTRRKKTEFLLDLIGKRGSDGFDHFCEAVRRNTTQLFVLRKILDCFQRKKDNFYGMVWMIINTYRAASVISLIINKYCLNPWP